MAAVLTVEAPGTGPALSPVALANARLLEAYCDGRTDEDFELLYNGIVPMVRRWAAVQCSDGSLVDEVVQATLIQVAKQADHIDPARLHAWLREVIRRIATRLHRRTGAASDPGHDAASDLALHIDIDSCLVGEEARTIIAEELRQLPEPLHKAVTLCYLQGVNARKAAKILGVPAGSMSMLLDRARRLLRPRLIHRGLSSAVILVLLSRPHQATAAESAIASGSAGSSWWWWLVAAATATAAMVAVAMIPQSPPPAILAAYAPQPTVTAQPPSEPVPAAPASIYWHAQEFPRGSLEWRFSGSSSR